MIVNVTILLDDSELWRHFHFRENKPNQSTLACPRILMGVGVEKMRVQSLL